LSERPADARRREDAPEREAGFDFALEAGFDFARDAGFAFALEAGFAFALDFGFAFVVERLRAPADFEPPDVVAICAS
jgi:hypothetical protein